ncbi:MAG: carbonic anhydrase [Patescibacteria group bacterium]
MPHQCKALVINCMDFRFHSAIREFAISLGLKDQYDLVSLAGASKYIVDKDPIGSAVLFKQVELSQKLHGISEMYLIHHMDCGAYGGHKAFATEQAEHDKQVQDMRATQAVLTQKFPQLQVKKVLARITEKGEENLIDFEVVS